MSAKPSSAWHASGPRWIAALLSGMADAMERGRQSPWPLQPCDCRRADEVLAGARERAQRWI